MVVAVSVIDGASLWWCGACSFVLVRVVFAVGEGVELDPPGASSESWSMALRRSPKVYRPGLM